MAALREWARRLWGSVHPSPRDSDLEEEIRLHLELAAEDLRAQGRSPEEAARAARLAVGGAAQTMEALRDQRGLPWLEDIAQDLRFAARTLRGRPGLLGAVVLTLGLGVGANATMFSFGDALAFRPFDVPHPSDLVRIFSSTQEKPFDSLSYREYLDVRERTTTLSGVAAQTTMQFTLARDRNDVAELVGGLAVSDNYFSTLGVEPTLGRSFRADEAGSENAVAVLVISDRLWKRRFRSDPEIVGRQVLLGRRSFTILGVAPSQFSGTVPFFQPDAYIPAGISSALVSSVPRNYATDRTQRNFTVLGRLKPGVTVSAANAEIVAIARALGREYPDTNRQRTAVLLPEVTARDKEQDNYRPAMLLLLLSGLALLVACLNVANLMLSRAVGRTKEIALRLALGASRGRLVRQLLAESLLLASLGAVCGLSFAVLGLRYMAFIARSILSNSDLPIVLDIRMDARLLMFTLLLSLGTAIVFGVAPALRGSRLDVIAAMKSARATGRGPRRWWSARGLLVTSQVALSIVVLSVAGIALRQFASVLRTDPGFRPDHVLLLTLDPSLVGYDQARTTQFYERLMAQTRALPGVTAVGLAQSIPLSGVNTGRTTALTIDGYEMSAGQQVLTIPSNIVDPGYWTAMRTPILRGRPFDARDTGTSQRVVIVNETMARRFWLHRDAVGGTVRLANGPALQVVGIVKDGKYSDITEPQQPAVFIPLAQKNLPSLAANMIVLGSGDVTTLAAPIRAVVHDLDAAMPVFNVRPLEAVYQSRAILPQRLIAQIMLALGALSLVLATVGLYGVVAYLTALRTHEISIRMALGASRRRVLVMVLNQGSKMVGVGLVAGLALALALTPAFAAAFNFAPRDGAVLALVALTLMTAAFMASVIPAQRAARINPSAALREE